MKMFCTDCRENLGQNKSIVTSWHVLAHPEKMRFDALRLCRGGILSCLIDVMGTELLRQVTEKPAGHNYSQDWPQQTESNVEFFHRPYSQHGGRHLDGFISGRLNSKALAMWKTSGSCWRTKPALRRCLLFARGESEEEPGLKRSGGAAAAKKRAL